MVRWVRPEGITRSGRGPDLGEPSQRLAVAADGLLAAEQGQALVDPGRDALPGDGDALRLQEVARGLAHDVELVLQGVLDRVDAPLGEGLEPAQAAADDLDRVLDVPGEDLPGLRLDLQRPEEPA